MTGNTTAAKVSVSGDDTVLNLVANSAPLEARIAGELQIRGLNVLSASISRGFVGLSSYSFVYTASLGIDDPTQPWTVDYLRAVVNGAVAAATAYTASTSVLSSNLSGTAGDPAQQTQSVGIPIIGDAVSAVSNLIGDASQTARLVLLGVGLLVVGGVLFVLIRPGEAASAARTVIRR